MDVLRKLTLRTLQKNRKRTVVTIIGIILATALLVAVANMAESFRASMIAYEKAESGDYHYRFLSVKQENVKFFENNRNIEKLGYEADLGYALLPESINPDKPYLAVKAMNQDAMQAISVKLLQGRLPESEEEIVISRHTQTNGGVEIAVGDVLSLSMGYRDGGDGDVLKQYDLYLYEEESFVETQEKTYTVVGIIERPSYEIEGHMAPGYTAITYLEDVKTCDTVNIYATYTKAALKNRDQVTAGILGVSEELYQRYMEGKPCSEEEETAVHQIAVGVNCNIWLIKWELLIISSARTMSMLYSMAGTAIVIIIATSVFCIRNSFVISLTEKLRLYGMLASVGTTRKQRKRIVYTEAAILGAIGIPLGIISGILATAIVVKLTSRLLLTSMGIELIFVVSFPAILIGILLSAVTVYLSAGQAARKAGKLSPISAIRGNGEIKIRGKKLHVPGIIGRLFGVGGTIAYKNLRRARGKYRTTVISIVVSVSIFIAMTTFINLGFKASTVYYEDNGYQLRIIIYDKDSYAKAQRIAALPEVEYAEIVRSVRGMEVQTDTLRFNPQYLEQVEHNGSDASAIGLEVRAIGEEAYAKYCEEVGVSVEEAADKGILVADYNMIVMDEEGNTNRVLGMMYDYRPGDVIKGKLWNGGEDGQEIAVELAAQTDIRPVCIKHYGSNGCLIVSDSWLEQYSEYCNEETILYMTCEDPDALELTIRSEMDLQVFGIDNMEQEYRRVQALYLLIAIFLYGFITVIALIGITNIFNTITTNMELRAREFAMLRSIGMTGREFRRMVKLESLFYGGKALLIGIPLGVFLSWCFHRGFAEGISTAFRLPWEGILISIGAVALLLFGIMRYSMGRINRRNMIETIQNENI